MNESFSSRVEVSALNKAVREFLEDGDHAVYVTVTIDDHGALTIAPDPVAAVTLENVPG